MEKVRESDTGSGMKINLFDRIGDYALVCSHTQEGNYFSGFEVYKIKIHKEAIRTINGKEIKYPERESYASASQFGKLAWAYPDLNHVYADFPQFKEYNDKIVNKLNKIKESLFPLNNKSI